MRFDILTLFPGMFDPILKESVIGKACSSGLIDIQVHDIRESAEDKHKTVDDTPYGGGTGMLLKVDVIDRAIQRAVSSLQLAGAGDSRPKIILLSPQGEKFTAKIAKELASESNLILVCGHYEGFDERIREHLVDRQISIGDYVLTGGELPAMVMVDAISRFVPGVLPEGAPEEDSHSIETEGSPAQEYPQYTKPFEYNGWKVPEVLLSGNHAEIAKWRKSKLRKVDPN